MPWNTEFPVRPDQAPASVVTRIGVVGYFFSYSIFKLFEHFRGFNGYTPDMGLLDNLNWLRCRIEARATLPNFYRSAELNPLVRQTNLRPTMALNAPTYRDDGNEMWVNLINSRTRQGRYPGRAALIVNSGEWHRRFAHLVDFRPLTSLPTGVGTLRQDIIDALSILHTGPADGEERRYAWTMIANLSFFLTVAAWAFSQHPRTIGISWVSWACRNYRHQPVVTSSQLRAQTGSHDNDFARTILREAGELPQAAAR